MAPGPDRRRPSDPRRPLVKVLGYTDTSALLAGSSTVDIDICGDPHAGHLLCHREPGHDGVHGLMTDDGMVTW